jgi:hypothetical protein
MQEDDKQETNETDDEEDEERKGKIIRQSEEVLLDLIRLLENTEIGSIQLGAFVDIVDRYRWKLQVERQRERNNFPPSLPPPSRTANQSQISPGQLRQLQSDIADELMYRQVMRDIDRSKAMIPGYYESYTLFRSLAKELVRAYRSQLEAEREPGEPSGRPYIPLDVLLFDVVDDLEGLLRAVYKKTLSKKKAKLERKLQ